MDSKERSNVQPHTNGPNSEELLRSPGCRHRGTVRGAGRSHFSTRNGKTVGNAEPPVADRAWRAINLRGQRGRLTGGRTLCCLLLLGVNGVAKCSADGPLITSSRLGPRAHCLTQLPESLLLLFVERPVVNEPMIPR